MAFVYQAQRNLDFSTKESNTLGPGSYISQGAYKIDPSQIPFNTRVSRDTTLKNPSLTLGPGAYETNRKTIKPDHMGRIKNSASFSSHINRFKLPGNSELVPGPGTYNIINSFSGPKHQVLLSKKDPLVLSMPTVPSIPSQNQAFGYDETMFGDLILQKNPNDVYSGKPNDSVGPGQYNPKPVIEIYGKKGPAWHKSNSKREFLKTSELSSLGPGTYTIDKSQTVYKLKSSAAFVSTCKRDSFIPVDEDYLEGHKAYDEDGTPGPGYYYKNFIESYNPKLVEFQKFGSGSRRFNEKINKMPGPGHYLGSKNNLIVIPESKAPFSSTDPRFTEKILVTPGPGHYDFSGRAENAKKTILAKEGAFGYKEPRFSEKVEDSYPGPGQYDHDNKIGVHNTAYHKTSSVFASKVEKNKHFPTSAGPPPWNYNIPSVFSPKEKFQSQILVNSSPSDNKILGFTSKDEKLKTKTNNVPGPGSYYKTSKKAYATEPKLEKNIKFGSKQERFSYKKDPFPGPGSYPDPNPWNKKTFNIQFTEFN